MQCMRFYDSDERAFLKERITNLLAVLYVCQTMSMYSLKMCAYLDSERKTAYQIERTRILWRWWSGTSIKNAFLAEVKREDDGIR